MAIYIQNRGRWPVCSATLSAWFRGYNIHDIGPKVSPLWDDGVRSAGEVRCVEQPVRRVVMSLHFETSSLSKSSSTILRGSGIVTEG